MARAPLARLLAALGAVRGASAGAGGAGTPAPGQQRLSPFSLVPLRNDTLLGAAVQHPPAVGFAAKAEGAAAAAACLRGGAAADLAPLRPRVEAALGAQGAKDCLRGAEHFYCEALLDIIDPWPLDSAPECGAAPPPPGPQLRMEVERDVALCFVVFMVNETEAVQQLLDFRGPLDSVVVHVDRSQPEALEDMEGWAKDQEGVTVISKWKVMRAGYSAGAALLDALEVAVRLERPWEVTLFLSGSHFWMRPRSELARFLFYHRTNFAAVAEEGSQAVDRRLFVAHGYELHYECGQYLWKVTWDQDDRSTVLLPHFGHPNISAASGQPFAVLRRDFVDWLVRNRKVQGSPVWAVLRYTMRMAANVERMLGTLLLTVAPWCHRTTVFHDMTFAKVAAREQKSQHNAQQEGVEEGFKSAGYLGVRDIGELRVVRWHVVTSVRDPHGREEDGPPPPPPPPLGIYRVTSEAERRAMDCENCHLNLLSFNWSLSTPAFVAFARKVDPALRALLRARDAVEPQPGWEPSSWPLGERIWELWASACSRDRTVGVRRRACDPRDEALPCAAEFEVAGAAGSSTGSAAAGTAAAGTASADETCACPAAISVRERVAVGDGRIFAMQAGSGWSSDARNFAEPGIVHASAEVLEVAYFPTLRRPYDLAAPMDVQVVLSPPQDSDDDVLETEKLDIRDVPKRAVASFPLQPQHLLSPGEWSIDLEVPESPLESIAHRSLHVYRNVAELTREIILRYFEVSLGECGNGQAQQAAAAS